MLFSSNLPILPFPLEFLFTFCKGQLVMDVAVYVSCSNFMTQILLPIITIFHFIWKEKSITIDLISNWIIMTNKQFNFNMQEVEMYKKVNKLGQHKKLRVVLR